MAHDLDNLSSTGTALKRSSYLTTPDLSCLRLSLSVKTPLIALVLISQGLNGQIYLLPNGCSAICLSLPDLLCLTKKLSCRKYFLAPMTRSQDNSAFNFYFKFSVIFINGLLSVSTTQLTFIE